MMSSRTLPCLPSKLLRTPLCRLPCHSEDRKPTAFPISPSSIQQSHYQRGGCSSAIHQDDHFSDGGPAAQLLQGGRKAGKGICVAHVRWRQI